MAGTLTPLSLAVLAVLQERPMHPYEIQQVMHDRHTDQVVKLRAGSLYHTVERLAERQLIEPVETTRAGRRPERTVYRITEEGRERYAGSVEIMLSRPVPDYPAFGAALSFLNQLDRAAAISKLKHRVAELRADLAGTDALINELSSIALPELYWIDSRYRRAMLAAELEFVRSLIERAESGELAWPAPGRKGEA